MLQAACEQQSNDEEIAPLVIGCRRLLLPLPRARFPLAVRSSNNLIVRSFFNGKP